MSVPATMAMAMPAPMAPGLAPSTLRLIIPRRGDSPKLFILARSEDGYFQLDPGAGRVDGGAEFGRVRGGSASDGNEEVSDEEARLGGRPIGLDARYDEGALPAVAEALGVACRGIYGQGRDAEPGMAREAPLGDLRREGGGPGARNRPATVALGVGEDEARQPAFRIDEGRAGEAGKAGAVGLDIRVLALASREAHRV